MYRRDTNPDRKQGDGPRVEMRLVNAREMEILADLGLKAAVWDGVVRNQNTPPVRCNNVLSPFILG